MNQYAYNTVSHSRQSDSSYAKYMSLKSAQTVAEKPVQAHVTYDVIESANGAFTVSNLAKKTNFGGDITGKIYLRSVHGSETPYAVQFYFERTPADKHKGEWLRIFSRTGVHLLDWKQIGNSLQAELNAAAWVTVHDGHDFSARVLIRITLDTNNTETGKEIEVFVSADNRSYNNVRALQIVVPGTGEKGAIRMAQRVPMMA